MGSNYYDFLSLYFSTVFLNSQGRCSVLCVVLKLSDRSLIKTKPNTK